MNIEDADLAAASPPSKLRCLRDRILLGCRARYTSSMPLNDHVPAAPGGSNIVLDGHPISFRHHG
jgi:hypothetical protein